MATSNAELISRQRQQRDISRFLFQETFNIPLSETHIGRLIGANGRNINTIREDNECDVFVSRTHAHDNEVTVTVRAVTADGLAGAKKDLIQMATQITEKQRKQKERASRSQETFTIPIPEEYSGLLIGDKGRHIIPISEALDCQIDVYHSPKRRAGCRGQSKETTVTITANKDVAIVRKALIRRCRHITKSQRNQPERSSHQDIRRFRFQEQETFSIPMSEAHIGRLIGANGLNINKIRKDNDCDVLVSRTHAHDNEVTVTVKAVTADGLAVAKKDLIQMATQITESQRNQVGRASRPKAHRGKRTRDSDATPNTFMSQKEVARMTYARRSRNRQIWKIKRRAWLRSPKNDMRNKRCYYCLATHRAKLDADSCRYHPGYINNGLVRGTRMLHWSCCQYPAADTTIQDQIYAHRNSGCSQGIHSWTLRRKKPEVKSNFWPELTKHINRCGASTPTEVRRNTERVENHARGCQANLRGTLTINIRAGKGCVVTLT